MFRNGEKQPKKLCLQTRLQTHLPTLSNINVGRRVCTTLIKGCGPSLRVNNP